MFAHSPAAHTGRRGRRPLQRRLVRDRLVGDGVLDIPHPVHLSATHINNNLPLQADIFRRGDGLHIVCPDKYFCGFVGGGFRSRNSGVFVRFKRNAVYTCYISVIVIYNRVNRTFKLYSLSIECFRYRKTRQAATRLSISY